MRLLIFVFVVCFFAPFATEGQEEQVNQQVWLEGLFDNSFGVKWDFFADVGYRQIFTEDENFWRVMARPSIKFQAWNWLDARGGLGVFYTQADENNYSLEIRPWQGIAISWPKIRRINFVHLFRAEQRIIYDPSDWTNEYTNRFRYQISTRINLTKNKKYKFFFIPLAAEIFLQSDDEVNELFRNRARFTLGLGYVFNRELTVDGKFVVERNRSDTLSLNFTDGIFRLRFRYNMFTFEEDETKL